MSTTILKSLKVIEYLAHAAQPKGITEIAREIDMNKSAVQRILGTLQASDYVEQAPGSSKYQLTLSIWELGSHVVERHQTRRLIHPILRYGAQATGFTTFLSYLSFPFIVYLDKVEGAHGRLYSAEPGSRVQITRTAAGKAVLAYLPESKFSSLTDQSQDWTGFVRFEGVEVEALRDEMNRIREQRFATSEGGLKQGVNAIAAPVWGREQEPYGSLVITADQKNMPRESFAEMGARIVSMASEATQVLGGANFQQENERSYLAKQ